MDLAMSAGMDAFKPVTFAPAHDYLVLLALELA